MKYINLIFTLFISFKGLTQFKPNPSFFRTDRELPLTELITKSTINVVNYGAVINDGIDDIAAITAALNDATANASKENPVQLLFEEGTYDLYPTDENKHSLHIKNTEGLLWDGNQAEFLIHNPKVGFISLTKCYDIIIQDITVDYAVLPFTQGIISKVNHNKGYFELTIDQGFPSLTEPYFDSAPETWGMIKTTNGSIKAGSPNLIPYTRFTQITNGVFRSPQLWQYLNTMEVGDPFVQIARNNGATIFKCNIGKNVTFQNITSYASPAGSYNAFNFEEWNMINCNVLIKPGRYASANADCIHVSGSTLGPWVENCTFEGFADDCVNLKYTRRNILEVHSETEITFLYSVSIGEEIEFYNPRDGKSLGITTITAVTNLGNNNYKATLSSPIVISKTGLHQTADKAYINVKSSESFVFRNNIVRNSRRYGLLLQNTHSIIENNLFENLSGSGIKIENGVDWGEGFRANQIEISNNTFINCGFDADYINDTKSASISVNFSKLGSPCNENYTWCGTEITDWQAHENIRILNNSFEYNKKGVLLENINGLELKDNIFVHNSNDISVLENEGIDPIYINNCSNVSYEESRFGPPNIHIKGDESPSSTSILNTGTNDEVYPKIINNGGTITIGNNDVDYGNTLYFDTFNNAEITLNYKDTDNNYYGPTGGAGRTYTFWIKPDVLQFQSLLMSGGPTKGEVFSIQMLASGVIRVTDNAENNTTMADLPIEANKWQLVSVTVPEDGSLFDIQLYKDEIASQETHLGTNTEINTSENVIKLFNKFSGAVSDIRYYDYKLYPDEINFVYQNRNQDILNLKPIQKSAAFYIYPTITESIITFSAPVNSIKIINLLGAIVYEKEGKEIKQLSISHLKSGRYLISTNINKNATIIIKR